MSRVVVNEIEAKVGNDISFNDTVKIDTIKGKTTAGSVTVQGEGAATTNLQQGLAKCWCHLTGSGTPSPADSFNVGSITDTASGRFTLNFSTNFGNANYVGLSGMVGNDGVTGVGRSQVCDATPATSAFAFRNLQCDSNADTENDDENIPVAFLGDLA